MTRLLVAFAAFSLLAAQPARADDYPPCTSHMQDHCRVMSGWGHHGGRHMGHHHHHAPPRHHRH